MILIPSRPIRSSISVQLGFKQKLYCGLRLRYNFDLFLIKIDCFDLFLVLKIVRSCLKDQKRQLKDQNTQSRDWKSWFKSKKSIYFDFLDHYQSRLISLQSLSIDLDLFRSILILAIYFGQIIIDFIAMSKNPASDLDQKSWLKVNLITIYVKIWLWID